MKAVTIFLALLAAAASAPNFRSTNFAPLLSSETAEVIQDQAEFTTQSHPHKRAGHGIHHVFEIESHRGYIGTFHPHELDEIRQSPEVAYVERDSMVYALKPEVESEVERDAPWGLSRVSHREHPDRVEAHHYPYQSDAGEGVTIYIVDTGVNIEHQDFEGRASWYVINFFIMLVTYVYRGATIPQGDADVDGNGHGTHCAGTSAGKTYGIAKKAKVVAVKVLRSNGSGTMSDVVKGIEWVSKHHKQLVEEYNTKVAAGEKPKKVKSAANMSLGGGKSRALDMAVNAAVASGVHFAVAAGNDDRDACNYSPAGADKAITVGATTIDDDRAWFSNYGKCVDIFAPGHEILSAWIGSKVATNTISGTSMASPHIAGIIASYLSRPEWESLSPADFKKKLLENGTKNLIKMGIIPPWGSGKLTPNLLVYTNPPEHKDKEDDDFIIDL
ncbi:serine protease [Clydaea vesicula]|uniref:Serine protease n=1 Tax=Clydaea vesicula TaxID=447962 RepID=A0AAD5U0J7_9FUNG|nr:serine protease [Clydaea vesicula]